MGTATDLASMTDRSFVCTYEQAIDSRQPSAYLANVQGQYRVAEHGHGPTARLSVQAVLEAGLSDSWQTKVRYWRMDLSCVR